MAPQGKIANSTEEDESIDTSDRSAVVNSVLNILETKEHFSNIKALEQGTFGDVHLMFDPQRLSSVAVKIVTSKAEQELEFWPSLEHENIVPLLEVMTLSSMKVSVFVMPVYESSLNEMVFRSQFRKRHDAFGMMKTWIYQSLCGLEYLHDNNLCHLDIKADNVLLCQESGAKICDFSFINTAKKSLTSYDVGLPYIYRPPEACLSANVSFDGKAFDAWSFGVMVAEIFTHFYLNNNLTKDDFFWLDDIYPTLYEILQDDTFACLMSKTLLHISEEQAARSLALNFIQAFLTVDCSKRMNIAEAKSHPFMKKKSTLRMEPDPIWKRKISVSMEEFNQKFIKGFEKCDQSPFEEKLFSGDEFYTQPISGNGASLVNSTLLTPDYTRC
ncbi:hypothetical protein JTE90_012596 [Oedothorax gibbosus]|uniref:Protein kinase domain-containing protein n=1 Tax=Oedothorax gibbosus TaxID=931172 RepID=A0AAV6V3B9_9ARAC|nr:hypothetical protein JTE90_012596 [Oedothorax gibbosus]